MAKTRRPRDAENDENNEELGVTTIPVGRRTITTVDQVPLVDERGENPDDDELDDPFEDVLAEIDQSQAAYHVYKEVEGKTKGVFCRIYKLPITYGELLMRIQEEYRGGDYTLFLHRGFGRGGMLRTVKTAIAEPQKKPESQVASQQNEMVQFLREQAMAAEKRNADLMLALIQRPQPPPPADPMEALGKALALINKASPPQQGGNGKDTLQQFLQFMEVQDRMKERMPTEREPGGSDLLMKFADVLAPMLQQALAARQGQPARAAIPAQPARPVATGTSGAGGSASGFPPGVVPPQNTPPGVLATAPPQSAPIADPTAQLTPYISMIIGAAERNADVEDTADGILKLLPDEIYDQVAAVVINDTLYMQLMGNPVFANYREWCDKFRQAVIEFTAEDRAHVSGGNTTGGIPPTGQVFNAAETANAGTGGSASNS